MAFEPDKWIDGEDGGTPITAAELNRIESAGAAKAAKGDKGDPGADGKDGAKGAKGDKGDPGADGFGTEEQYNDLVSRIEALEGAVAG
ncbi:hypothetical protein [Brevibacterium sediminis]|uniref:hypothetical protein n=1 Tax=Brevibacterium sediminis TaxID=1857024 RepID=UPI001C586250|nr:hypothetical protein [Brevibacterium sediminis]